MRRILIGGILLLMLVPGVSFPVQQEEPRKEALKADVPPDTTADDQKMLRALGMGIDGPALLDYFKKRTYPEANPKEMVVLIQQLGDEDFDIREKAHERLLVLGAGALVGIK